MTRLQELRKAGQSPWLDNLSRELLATGHLKELIDEGLCGVTSNPSIFQKALAEGERYDGPLKDLLARGLREPRQLFFALALEDIASAADLLRPVFDCFAGGDGFVSLEVSPDLAFDSAATIAEATRLFASLNRPNVMIKVPATLPGLTAIEELTAAGVNVNVTLLFSVPRYRQVMEAYLKGLERRLAAGQPIGAIASVASFFVSRVDVMIDNRLDELRSGGGKGPGEEPGALRGRAAVANARLAYQAFGEIFAAPRFQALQAHGGPGAAAALGEHQHQGPRVQRHQVRAGTDRSGHGQHHAGRNPARLRRPRQRQRDDRRGPRPGRTALRRAGRARHRPAGGDRPPGSGGGTQVRRRLLPRCWRALRPSATAFCRKGCSVMQDRRVGLAADHGGFEMKRELAEELRRLGYQVVDFGAGELAPEDDYPDFVIPLARAVAAGEIERGIALCGSGIGASVAANKIPGVRAGLVHDGYSAHQGVEHDAMNVMCIGARVIGPALAADLMRIFLQADFSGAARHRRRLAKIAALEAHAKAEGREA